MAYFNGSHFRALINDEPIKGERKISFEVSDIRVKVLAVTDEDVFGKWTARKNEQMNFKISNTDINLEVILTNVILIYEQDCVAEIELRFL
jgi:hypothetical protein